MSGAEPVVETKAKLPGLRRLFNRKTLKKDAVAGVVLGVESVPDGLAGGLLAAVNPVYGLYAYMTGTIAGALTTSSSFMVVQATGAMAIIVADVDLVHSGEDPARALFTLAILTGLVMLLAGLLKLGSILRFVSNSVMVGFISAVGANIVLGQLDDFTGYASEGPNRVSRAFDLVLNIGQVHFQTLLIGVLTIVLILVLEKTKLGALGLVVAIVATSVLAFFLSGVAVLDDIADVPNSLPLPMWPDFSLTLNLLVPAIALAFVGLVQGAGISASIPREDGTYADPSQDFVGQGVGNIVAGFFQGMPVGGSMSGSSLVKSAGAKSRAALVIASFVMAIVIVLFGSVVGYIAMPALAGLLIVVGFRTIKPRQIEAVWKTGAIQATVMSVTLVLTMLIPLQMAVLVGVGISMILYIIRQSNALSIRSLEVTESGDIREVDAPEVLAPGSIVVLQPYGSLFFASAKVFEEKLPDIEPTSSGSVVVLRLRGMSDLGTTLMEVISRYASALLGVDSKLMIVTDQERVIDQLEATGLESVIGVENIYTADEWLGHTVKRAHADAMEWVASAS